jgi:5'-3' exoribonuclease 2
MNQQRSRRFQSSKEAMKKRKELAVIRNRLSNQGVQLPPKHSSFDSNQITPGTAFMVRLAAAFRYFIHLRVTAHPAWQKLVVNSKFY